MRISVAVITYNWPAALEQVLRALAAQSELPYEVIVTDDGSQPATRELVARIAQSYPVRLVYLWQTDDGARMSRARNRAIAAAQGDYLILLDGDMVTERHFVADHHAYARRGCFVQGSRVLTDAPLTRRMLEQNARAPGLFSRGIERRRHTLRLPARRPAAPERFQRGDDRLGARGHRAGGTRLPRRPAATRAAFQRVGDPSLPSHPQARRRQPERSHRRRHPGTRADPL
jgi:glycosyltransferase involved in cell wall biosynthesis